MAVLHVRNIPDKVYRQAQAIAAARGVTLSAHILELLKADIAVHEARKPIAMIGATRGKGFDVRFIADVLN